MNHDNLQNILIEYLCDKELNDNQFINKVKAETKGLPLFTKEIDKYNAKELCNKIHNILQDNSDAGLLQFQGGFNR